MSMEEGTCFFFDVRFSQSIFDVTDADMVHDLATQQIRAFSINSMLEYGNRTRPPSSTLQFHTPSLDTRSVLVFPCDLSGEASKFPVCWISMDAKFSPHTQ